MRAYSIVIIPLLLAACSPADMGNQSNESAAAEAESDVDGVEVEQPAKSPDLERTAWRAIAQDGAVFTTFLDENGRYRDFRNGDAWRDGNWRRNDDGQLCFTPTDENLAGECWKLKKPNSSGVMRATNNADLTIKLQQVTYIAPDDQSTEAEPQD